MVYPRTILITRKGLENFIYGIVVKTRGLLYLHPTRPATSDWTNLNVMTLERGSNKMFSSASITTIFDYEKDY